MNGMIDLETLDKKPTSVIVSVGICAFDIDGIHDKKYFILDCEEQMEKGRTISFDTLEWWFRQSKEVTDAAFNQPDKLPIKKFLEQLGYFCAKNNIKKMYAQGTDFDLPMIRDLHDQYNHELPYDYWLARDTRTVYEFMKSEKPPRTGVHHNAMDDAIYQAQCVILAMKERK